MFEHIFSEPAPIAAIVRKGSLGDLQKALKKRPGSINAMDDKKQTALHVACEQPNISLVQELLQRGANINAQDVTGWTALHRAIHARQFEIAELLLQQKADVALVSCDGSSPLHLITQVNINNNEESALFRLIDKLRLAGAKTDATTIYGETPLHRACLNSSSSAALLYLLDNTHQLNLNTRTLKGFTCLHYAIMNNKTEAVKLMLQRGADPTLECLSGTTIELAEKQGALHLVPLLEEAVVQWNKTKETSFQPARPSSKTNLAMDHRNSFLPKGHVALSSSCPASTSSSGWIPVPNAGTSSNPTPPLDEEEYDEQIENLLISSKGQQFGEATVESMLQLKQLGKSKLNDFFAKLKDKEKLFPAAFSSYSPSGSAKLLDTELSTATQEDEEENTRVIQKTRSFLDLAKVAQDQPNNEKSLEKNLSLVAASFCAGEFLCESVGDIMCGFLSINDRVIYGDLFLTNFQLIFRSKSGSTNWSAPCTAIDRILPVGEIGVANQEKDKKYEGFGLYRKDFDVDIIIASRGDKLDSLIHKLKTAMACNPVSSIFAFSFSTSGSRFSKNQCATSYVPDSEYDRLNLNRDCWRLSDMNQDYSLCSTYPSLLAVPKGISDSELTEMASFRTRGRLPVAVWRSHTNGSVIIRCSQPRVGVADARNRMDEKFFQWLKTNHKAVYLFDARPKISAMANRLRGGGFEKHRIYKVKPRFLNIENIHTMRHCLEKIRSNCAAYVREEVKQMDASIWLNHISLLLQGAVAIAKTISESKEPVAVVIHCSDGWDRTTQLLSLAELLLDPTYRTHHGFETLVEKDWLSFGHKFAERTGHTHQANKEKERSPIFLQFIECVWQIWNQFPTAFTFNEKFLLVILENLYSCRYGTFLCDSEKERTDHQVLEQTQSLWTYIHNNIGGFFNHDYQSSASELILDPKTDRSDLAFWTSYYQMRMLMTKTLVM